MLYIHLFGKLCLQYHDQQLDGPDSRKAQELFCYLLLYRHRPHPRETLAGLLWGDMSINQSKTYLRKALWQLQVALDRSAHAAARPVLLAETDWLQINSQADLWLDVAVLEHTFMLVQDMPGEQMSTSCAESVRKTMDLYQGDLLEGCYQDWCLFERERLQNIYLALLNKLMGYSEVHHEYEQGLAYGATILRYDRAREETHRRLMRLHYLTGNRSAALRQYERCTTALEEELGVRPTAYTMALYEQIRANRHDDIIVIEAHAHVPGEPGSLLAEVLGRLKQLQANLAEAQERVQHDIRLVEQIIRERC